MTSYEEVVKRDFDRNKVFVPQEAFLRCMGSIRDWINIPSLMPQLMMRGLVRTSDDHFWLGDSQPPSRRVDNLVTQIAPKAGRYGHHLLYMCIRDASDNLGHIDAAKLLKDCGTNHLPTPDIPPEVPLDLPLAALPASPSVPVALASPTGAGATTTIERTTERQNTQGEVKKSYEKTTVTSRTIMESAQRVAPPTTAPPTPLSTMAPLQESRNNTGTDMDSLSSSDASLVSLDCPRLLEHVGGAVGGASDPSLPAKMEARVLYSSRSSEVLDRVQEMVRNVNVAEINDDYETYDLECLPRDLSGESERISSMCITSLSQFVVANLNSRFDKKMGVHVAGIRATGKIEKPFAYEGVPFVPTRVMIEGFLKRLQQTVFVQSLSDGRAKAILPQHLTHMVSLSFLPATAADVTPGKRNPGEEYFGILTVVPDLEICKDGLFFLSPTIDKNGLPRASEVYKRSDGSSVRVQPNRISALEAQIKRDFSEIAPHVARR